MQDRIGIAGLSVHLKTGDGKFSNYYGIMMPQDNSFFVEITSRWGSCFSNNSKRTFQTDTNQ